MLNRFLFLARRRGLEPLFSMVAVHSSLRGHVLPGIAFGNLECHRAVFSLALLNQDAPGDQENYITFVF